MEQDELNTQEFFPNEARRTFLKQSSLLAAMAAIPYALVKAAKDGLDEKTAGLLEKKSLSIEINRINHKLLIEPRTTLLDLLREQLALTGTKKVVITDSVVHVLCISMGKGYCPVSL